MERVIRFLIRFSFRSGSRSRSRSRKKLFEIEIETETEIVLCCGLAALPAAHDVLVRLLLLVAGLHAFALAPGRDRRPAAARLALTPAQRMVDRVHCDAAYLGPLALPAIRTRFA